MVVFFSRIYCKTRKTDNTRGYTHAHTMCCDTSRDSASHFTVNCVRLLEDSFERSRRRVVFYYKKLIFCINPHRRKRLTMGSVAKFWDRSKSSKYSIYTSQRYIQLYIYFIFVYAYILFFFYNLREIFSPQYKQTLGHKTNWFWPNVFPLSPIRCLQTSLAC